MEDKTIRNNLKSFYDPIIMLGGYSFNHVDRLKTNALYWNSQFKTGKYDNQGFRKFFINKVKPPCEIASKFVDLDTKDLPLRATKEGQEFKVSVMNKRLKQWMKDNGTAKLLNKITAEYPKGHVVIKKGKEGWDMANIANLRMDTTAQYLSKSDYVYEVMRMSKGEIDDMNWDTSELYSRQEYGMYDIYDCYTRTGKKKWKREVKASLFCTNTDGQYKHGTEANINSRDNYLPSIVLFTEEVNDLPYRELKWEDVPGRWLGYGFIEYLEDDQVSTNDAEALERKGLMFTSLKLYQTRDDAVGGSNVLTNAQNGDIIKTDSEITPMAMEERNLPAFNAVRARIDKNIQEKTFTFDASKGDNLPSRTPLGVANVQVAMITSYFDLKRENYGEFLRDWITNDVVPDFQKDNYQEHYMTYFSTDDDIDAFRELFVKTMVDDISVKYALETGFFPSQTQKDEATKRLMDDLRSKKNAYIKVINGWYKDAHFIVDVDPTGEQLDISTLSQTLQLGMQTLGTNPAILQNPQTKAIFFKLMELGGVNPADIGLMKNIPEAPQAAVPAQGGSVASPVAPTLQPVQQ